jgi:hypothetical protein
MKRFKVIFVNKSKLSLHVQCKKSGSNDQDEFVVNNRNVLRLIPGQYEMTVYYEGRTALISSNMVDAMDIIAVTSPNHSRFSAKQIVLSLPEQNVKIVFRDQISVGSILDGSARTRF